MGEKEELRDLPKDKWRMNKSNGSETLKGNILLHIEM